MIGILLRKHHTDCLGSRSSTKCLVIFKAHGTVVGQQDISHMDIVIEGVMLVA
jgi:hypothetical protein